MKLGKVFTEKFITNMVEHMMKSKKKIQEFEEDDMRSEYDFSKGVRGKYYEKTCGNCITKQEDRFDNENPTTKEE